MSLSPGTRLGHYDVTALIGEGGMGQVYQATDTQLNRQVALKILPDAFAEDPDRLGRFQREAQVLASLNHPGIAAIHGIEKSGHTRALVLELVEGPTLEDRIAKGPIPIDEALPLAKQITEALEAAHEAGVIHRDLKPANIKVRDDGTVKVLDFSLAKALEPAPASDPDQSPTLTAAATQLGVILGTAAYMSPEQARGKPVDKRADIWAFGAVLYEMLTGRRAFEGEDVSLTLAEVMKSDPDLSSLPAGATPALRSALTRCLTKDPNQRVRDIGDVRLAMEGAFEISVSAEPMPVPRLRAWQRPIPAGGGVLMLVIVSSLVVWTLSRPAPPRVVRFPIPLAADQSFFGIGRPLAISPDGSRVAYSTNNGLWVRSVDRLDAVQVLGVALFRSFGGAIYAPFFSADGQWIAFSAAGQLQMVPTTGGAPVVVTDLSEQLFSGATWGADGTILYGHSDGIMQVPSAGGSPDLLIPARDAEIMHAPQMLSGGEWVLFTVVEAGPSQDEAGQEEAQIVVESVTTGERMVLIEEGLDGRYLPTGHLVYGLDNRLFAVPFDVGAREVTGVPVPIVEGVSVERDLGQGLFAVSDSGSLVYLSDSAERDQLATLVWVSRDGDEENISAPPRAYGRPRVSPDRMRVAVDIADGDTRDIWIWDLVRENLTQLTFDPADDNYPLWTPEGARVVFTSSRDGGGLFWKAADGTGQVERLKDGLARPYAWTGDGRLIFTEAGDIGVLTVDGERHEQMLLDTEDGENEPALSSDGRFMAYVNGATGPRVYVVPFPNVDGGLWNVSVDYGVHPVWPSNGSELFYRTRTDLMAVEVETEPTFGHGTPHGLFSTVGYTGGTPTDARTWDLAPEGDRFIFPRRGTGGQRLSLIYVENWTQELLERVPIP